MARFRHVKKTKERYIIPDVVVLRVRGGLRECTEDGWLYWLFAWATVIVEALPVAQPIAYININVVCIWKHFSSEQNKTETPALFGHTLKGCGGYWFVIFVAGRDGARGKNISDKILPQIIWEVLNFGFSAEDKWSFCKFNEKCQWNRYVDRFADLLITWDESIKKSSLNGIC